MAAEGVFPNLGMVSCIQLTFGADIRLTPGQVGALRDSILAMFPLASAPPWYFREVYGWGDIAYEVAASISASSRSDPSKPYSAFFRIQTPGEQAIEGPRVQDLFRVLDPQEESSIYCTASFARNFSEGQPYAALPHEAYRDRLGRLTLESYSVAIYDETDERIGTAEVRRIGSDTTFYSVSFSEVGRFSAAFSSALLERAAILFRRIHRESEEGTHAENSA
jgi:hypothetical protein